MFWEKGQNAHFGQGVSIPKIFKLKIMVNPYVNCYAYLGML